MEEGNKSSIDYLQEPFSRIGYKMHLLLQVGKALMESGADTDRTVRDMKRAAAYMGIPPERIHQHTMYTTLMLNVNDDQHSYTEFCKCRNHGINMTTLSAVSKLTWKALARNYTLESFERHIMRIKGIPKEYTVGQTALGAGAACGGFCVLFGGSLLDFFITAVCACFGFYVRRLCTAYAFNTYATIAITSFVTTILAWSTQFLTGGLNWYPLIACTLFLVPGIPLINAVDDLLNNFIVAGMTRAMHTVLVVSSMTFGIVIAIRLCGVTDFTSVQLTPDTVYFSQAIAAAIGAVGFSIIFNVPPRILPVVAVGGIITVMIRNIAVLEFGFSQTAGSFLGAAVVGLIALKAIHWFHTPNIVITIPSAIPMIPGVLLYRLLFALLNLDFITTEEFFISLRSGINAITIIIGIAVGVAIPNIFIHRQIERRKQDNVHKLLAKRYAESED
jgi:uncharacterized membrane protein YjjP (DUF1212 family)